MENSLLQNVYNPDVLSCIANLSSDEVFTPPALANKMIDMLPQEVFENPDTTFLDPCCKSGVFLREIAKRLIKGLEPQIPDLEKRVGHIFSKQLFGVAITELTSLLSRRSVYCSKYPNSQFSAYRFPENKPQGNIIYQRINHTWQNGKCIYCGASQNEYGRDSDLETYAYLSIHNVDLKKLFHMKFDVIIGNPPYQLSDGSGASTDAASPVYDRFILQAIKLMPTYLIMIVPSKWMVGGRGLSSFRKFMISDKRIRILHDYEDANDCFPGVHIDGGVSYFLWDKDYNGRTRHFFYSKDGKVSKSLHFLKNDYFDFVIRDSRIIPILDKIGNSEIRFSTIVSTTKPYGIRKFLFNQPERCLGANLSEQAFKDSVKIYGVKGIKGGARRMVGYISKNYISSNIDTIDKYKLFFTTSYSTSAINPPEVIVAGPNEVCTETFLLIGAFDSDVEQLNCLSYIKTNFFKVLLYYGKGTMQVNKDVFSLIPLQDFSHPWTDEMLYKKYNLTQEEINFIESMIKPME